jgi:GT2 family glycosyltransferase
MASKVPSPTGLATVVVVAWNGAELIRPCLDALAAQVHTGPFDTWVIDNASSDDTAALVAQHPLAPRLVTLENNLGFAGAAELAVREAVTPFVVLLNQDARPEPGWLAALMAPLTAPNSRGVGAVTSKVLLAGDGRAGDGRAGEGRAGDGRLNNTAVVVGRDGYGHDRGFGEPDDGRYDVAEDVFAFSGTAAAVRVVAAREVGSFDPSFFLYYEDTDLSWRMQLAGWRIRYEPGAVVSHLHAASSDIASASFAFHNERNRLLMLLKCAPAMLVAREVLRFAAITALLPGRRIVGVQIPPGHQFRTSVRLRVLGSFARQLPTTLAKRRAMTIVARRSRADVARALGFPPQ